MAMAKKVKTSTTRTLLVYLGDTEPILKIAVTAATGETGDIQEALEAAAYFGVSDDDARVILTRMMAALNDWKRLARSPAVKMSDDEIDKVAPAFENFSKLNTVARNAKQGETDFLPNLFSVSLAHTNIEKQSGTSNCIVE